MKCSRQAQWWFALAAAGQISLASLPAQEAAGAAPAPKSISPPTNSPPPWAHGKSPVDFFRQLLAITPDERAEFLTNRPPEIRARILVKVSEYEAIGPDERELRLRTTELRWYLMPLLREPPASRAARLAQIPDDLRELVQSRLEEWTILPPTLQQEFLENEHVLHYFARVDAGNSPADNFARPPSEAERTHWNELSEAERRQVAAGFNQFFDLTPEEKQKALNTLSETERRQMEKTLQSFDQMPSLQRAECVNAFAKFASMNAMDQAEFLKNAERWSALSPAERQAWRDLVVNVPQWPPLPAGFVPPAPGEPKSGMATNRN